MFLGGIVYTYSSSCLEHLDGKNISEFTGSFRHPFQIRQARHYIFYYRLTGFQDLYPTTLTVHYIRIFQHIKLIVLGFLEGDSVSLTTMAVVQTMMVLASTSPFWPS